LGAKNSRHVKRKRPHRESKVSLLGTNNDDFNRNSGTFPRRNRINIDKGELVFHFEFNRRFLYIFLRTLDIRYVPLVVIKNFIRYI